VSPSERIPTVEDVRAAASLLRGHAIRTPLLEARLLNEELGCRLLVKAECLQRTGSFKFRGAFNAISRLPDAARDCGVVAFSSGNHAQGVAAAAQALGVRATIVMPEDAPAMKIANTRAYGARIVLYNRLKDDRAAIAQALADKEGLAFVHPYDDPDVMAGQGTVGLELMEQAADLGATVDAVLAPASGGGLVGGVALAVKAERPEAEVWTTEPEGYDDHALSFAAGKPVAIQIGKPSLADALLAPQPGAITFAVNQRLLAGSLVVSDREAQQAMAAAFRHLKLVLEPGGAVALAAVLSGKLPVRGRTIAVVGSGGNVDAEVYRAALAV
jgi:threonine dehydratase